MGSGFLSLCQIWHEYVQKWPNYGRLTDVKLGLVGVRRLSGTRYSPVRTLLAKPELFRGLRNSLGYFSHVKYLLSDTDIDIPCKGNKKLSYRRETARQLHMTTWAGQLTF